MLMSSRYPKASTEDAPLSTPAAKPSKTSLSAPPLQEALLRLIPPNNRLVTTTVLHFQVWVTYLMALTHWKRPKGEAATGCWCAANAQPASPHWPQTSFPKGCWARHKLSVPQIVLNISGSTCNRGNGGCKTEELLCQTQESSRSRSRCCHVLGSRGKGEDVPPWTTHDSLWQRLFSSWRCGLFTASGPPICVWCSARAVDPIQKAHSRRSQHAFNTTGLGRGARRRPFPIAHLTPGPAAVAGRSPRTPGAFGHPEEETPRPATIATRGPPAAPPGTPAR